MLGNTSLLAQQQARVTLMSLNVQMFVARLGAFKLIAPNVIVDKRVEAQAYKNAFRRKYKSIFQDGLLKEIKEEE